MSTWFNSQVGEGKYAIQMETSSKELYDVVQEKIRSRMDDERLGDQPNIRPRMVKRGKWEQDENMYDDSTWVCSCCGEPWVLIDGRPHQNNMNFCPNCGADMSEVQK